jgi:Uma2 family endonuclease
MRSSDPPRRATYADPEKVPPTKVAELIKGVLHVSPRPAAPHAVAATSLGGCLFDPFFRGKGGPGGWVLLDEPELHLREDVLVPDLAGWRRERMPVIPEEAFFTLVPDWVCELISPSTAALDRADKLPVYAAAHVSHA